MGMPSPQMVKRYGVEFKLAAVAMSESPGVLVQDIAEIRTHTATRIASKFLPTQAATMPFKRILIISSVLCLQAQAQTVGLQRCPTIEDPVARLACYDAAMPPTFLVTRPPGDPKLPAPNAAAAAAAAVPASTSAKTDKESSFGLADVRDANEVRAIESMTVPGFSEWRPNERIRLENGQVWQVTDGSSGRLRHTPSKVTIRKGFFGAFFMVFQDMNLAPKVERVK